MTEKDYWTLKAMTKFGGGFVKKLAELCYQADPINLQKIKECWPNYFLEYGEMGFRLMQNDKK